MSEVQLDVTKHNHLTKTILFGLNVETW